jgi:imidazolonepropionase
MVDKIKGLDYAAIAAKGGGILSTAKAIAQTSENDLYAQAMARIERLVQMGTGAFEIKSGYGLDLENELKMLRVIRRLKESLPIPIRSSFLGAHSYPLAFRQNHEGYLQLIEKEMLPAIVAEGLADYVDVFCETGFFSLAETKRICVAAQEKGLGVKLHANQLSAMGAVELGVALGAISVDHLETMDAASMNALANADTIGTLLPGAAFFLRQSQPPARELLQAGAALALASDFNPGSCPTGNMNLVLALACIQAKLLPAEALNAATLNGAFAMGLQKEVGSIAVGKKANLIFTSPIPSLDYLAYAFGDCWVNKVMVNGQFI